MKILVTGGCGFIGSNFIRHTLRRHPDARIINLDKLTYAGNPENLADVETDARYEFVQGDICDPATVERVFARGVDLVFNFAAETHVDRSIGDPGSFVMTDTYGVYVLLEALRRFGGARFVQISTDEVYGSIEVGAFRESDPLNPRNPYAASKAGGDRLAYAYFCTHGLPVLITRASNNLGPNQYPEKIVPLFTTNAIDDLPLPLYGDGGNVRDWLYVEDHCEALWVIAERGCVGEVYNVGGGAEITNLDLTRRILAILGKPESLIQPVVDRPGHDRRYALCCDKLRALGWTPRHDFDAALRDTVQWYVKNQAWWRKIKSGEFRKYYEAQYRGREV
ncbi:dTDP-glucose 4,6-dehydratase [bacterium]|nr:dTDP-glucose 4,6-dehydratase [bacterium]